MTTLKPRALIFDMDGLMIDSEPLWWQVERSLAEDHGIRWSDELAKRCIGTGLRNAADAMRDLAGLTLSTDDAVAELIRRFRDRIPELQLKPGLLELLDASRAADLPLAVASSSPATLIAQVLQHFELRNRFVTVVSGESVPQPKPAPDVFLETAKQLAKPPAACLVFEDSQAGVTSARNAGMTVIAVPEGETAAFHALTPHVVGDLHEAQRLLQL